MVIMAMDMVPSKKLIVALALTICHSLSVANEWRFDPTLKLNGTHTDNVNYSNDTSSFVTLLGLGVKSNYLTKSTSFNLTAETLAATYTHDHDLDDNFLTLNSKLNVQLWPNGISFIASADIQNLSANNVKNIYSDLISGDTIQVERYSSGFNYNLRNSKYDLRSSLLFNSTISEDKIGEQDGYSASITSQNGQNSDYLFWDLSGNYLERNNNNRTGKSYQTEVKLGLITPYNFIPFIRYYDEDNTGNVGANNSVESNSYGAGFRWSLSPRLLIDLSYNTPFDEDLNEEQSEYVDVKVNWQPTIRTTLNAGLSQRFYGDSYNINLRHKNKRLTNTISYSETVQTFTRDNISLVNLGLFWCPRTENTSLSNCYLSNNNNLEPIGYTLQQINDFEVYEDDNFSLNKRLSWVSNLTLSRTSITFSANRNERIDLKTNIKGIQESADLKLSRKFSGYSSIDLSFSYTATDHAIELSNATKSQYRIYKLDYNRNLNKTLTFTLGLSHLNRTSDPAIYVYKENRIKFEIKKVL